VNQSADSLLFGPLGNEAAAPLARLRIGLGCVVILKAWHLATLIGPLTAVDAIRTPYLASFAPGARGILVLSLLLAISGGLVALGWRSQASAGVSSLLLIGVLLIDRQFYSNHLYLLIILMGILAASDSGAVLAVDARARPPRTDVAAWPMQLFRAQLSIVYGFAALAKLNPSYLSGAALSSFLDAATEPTWVPQFLQLASLGSIAGELFVAIGLWFKATRRAAVVVGIALHLGMIALIDYPLPLLLFAAQMLLLYPLFFNSRSSKTLSTER